MPADETSFDEGSQSLTTLEAGQLSHMPADETGFNHEGKHDQSFAARRRVFWAHWGMAFCAVWGCSTYVATNARVLDLLDPFVTTAVNISYVGFALSLSASVGALAYGNISTYVKRIAALRLTLIFLILCRLIRALFANAGKSYERLRTTCRYGS